MGLLIIKIVAVGVLRAHGSILLETFPDNEIILMIRIGAWIVGYKNHSSGGNCINEIQPHLCRKVMEHFDKVECMGIESRGGHSWDVLFHKPPYSWFLYNSIMHYN